jgi:hypothetical protein
MLTAIHDVLMETIRLLTFTPGASRSAPREHDSDERLRPKAVFSGGSRRP